MKRQRVARNLFDSLPNALCSLVLGKFLTVFQGGRVSQTCKRLRDLRFAWACVRWSTERLEWIRAKCIMSAVSELSWTTYVGPKECLVVLQCVNLECLTLSADAAHSGQLQNIGTELKNLRSVTLMASFTASDLENWPVALEGVEMLTSLAVHANFGFLRR